MADYERPPIFPSSSYVSENEENNEKEENQTENQAENSITIDEIKRLMILKMEEEDKNETQVDNVIEESELPLPPTETNLEVSEDDFY